MQLNDTDIAVDRMHLKGRGIPQSQAVDAINNAHWPRPANGEWLFIRKLDVKTSLPFLGLRVSSAARRMAERAVDGGSSLAAHAGAVRFRNLHALLAQLSLELAQGRASQNWYWRQWSHLSNLSASTALQSLWCEYIAQLPGVIEELARRSELASVWRALDRPAAQQILHGLELHTRIPYTRMFAPPALPSRRQQALPAAIVRALPAIQSQWSLAVESLRADEPSRLLAAAYAAMRWAPMHTYLQPEVVLPLLSEQLCDTPISDRGLVAEAHPRGRDARQIEEGMQAESNASILTDSAINPRLQTPGTVAGGDSATYRCTQTITTGGGRGRRTGSGCTATYRCHCEQNPELPYREGCTWCAGRRPFTGACISRTNRQ